MAIAMLIATITFSVCSFICLLWLNVATVMRMIVIGSVVITTNVLTKAIILPSIFNILVSLFLDAKLAIILITCCAATAFYLHFSPILAKLERFPRNSSKNLANSLHVQIFISTFAIAKILMWSIPHKQRARRYVQAQPTIF